MVDIGFRIRSLKCSMTEIQAMPTYFIKTFFFLSAVIFSRSRNSSYLDREMLLLKL